MMIGFEYKNSATRKLTRVFVPSFSLLTCMIHMGIEFPIRDGNPPPIEVWFGREIVLRGKEGPVRRIPIDNDGAMYVDFNASYEDFRRVNFVDAAVGDVSADVDGKLVMIGLAATGSTDIGPCPLSADTPLVHVHAMAASNILRGSHIAPIGTAARVALYCAVFVVMTAVCAVVRTLRLLPVPFVGAFGYGLVAYLSVHFGLAVMPVFAPLLYIGFCSFTVLGYRYWTEERGKRRIRNMFSTMVSADVLDYLEENPDSFSLAGHYADATVFFSDIADFTALSEGLPSVRVTEFLNSYLTPVTDCVMRHGGYVNKFMGDLVMAVWGAPFPTADHAEKACRAALEQQEIIAELNRGIAAKYGFEIRARMGVNTGMVAAGNMGSRRRSEYTVIGDVVNTASRIEPANRDYGTKILVSDATRKLVADSMVLRQVDRLIVKGKTEALDIYELMCEKESASVEILQLAGDYERALWRYFQMDWTGALAAADAILARGPDGPTEKLRKRILHYMENPPPKDWRRTRVRREKD